MLDMLVYGLLQRFHGYGGDHVMKILLKPVLMKAPSVLSVPWSFSRYVKLTASFFYMFSKDVCSITLSMSSSVSDFPRKSAILLIVPLLSFKHTKEHKHMMA